MLKASLGEESITDFFVLALKNAAKGTYYINSFTRPKEKITGADWELWFTGASGKWTGLRVQAKVISLDGTRYSQLHYKQRDGTNQIDTLIADAKKHRAVPLYCLYSNWEEGAAGKISWPCGTVNRNIELFGASILPVANVQSLKASNENSLKSIAKHLSPLHCLFCCNGYGGSDLPSRALSFLVNRHYTEPDGTRLLDQPPHYVSQVLEGVEASDLLNVSDENLRRVTVIWEIEGEKSNYPSQRTTLAVR
jgi:hypothetical protein